MATIASANSALQEKFLSLLAKRDGNKIPCLPNVLESKDGHRLVVLELEPDPNQVEYHVTSTTFLPQGSALSDLKSHFSTLKLQDKEFSQLLTSLEKLTPYWFNFFIKLDVSYSKLKTIENDNRNIAEKCLTAALELWVNSPKTKEMTISEKENAIKAAALEQSDHDTRKKFTWPKT